MRILIVEDERRLALYLQKGLTENGYVVDIAPDGIEGKHLALEGEYDLVLLGVMIPGLDGFGVTTLSPKQRQALDPIPRIGP